MLMGRLRSGLRSMTTVDKPAYRYRPPLVFEDCVYLFLADNTALLPKAFFHQDDLLEISFASVGLFLLHASILGVLYYEGDQLGMFRTNPSHYIRVVSLIPIPS